MRRSVFLLVCLMIVFGGAGYAPAGEWTAAIQRQYESLNGFSARFTQTLTNASTGESEVRTGSLAFKRPGLIRWETRTPEPELLIVGHDAVWDFFPEEETAYKYPVSEVLSSKTMIRFISGKADLEEDFRTEDQGTDQGLRKIKLIPREPEANLVLAYVWVDPETRMLEKVFLVDFFGNGNELALEETIIDPELGDDLFRFSPPVGVETVDNTGDQAG
jgi:outer membrane lipoprotein carrier protein